MNKRVGRPGEPFDLAAVAWIPDYPDPSALLNALLAGNGPTLRDPLYQRRLAEAERLSGPRRYLAYGRLAVDIARNAAPFVVFGNENVNDFFSTRIGCQTYATLRAGLRGSLHQTAPPLSLSNGRRGV